MLVRLVPARESCARSVEYESASLPRQGRDREKDREDTDAELSRDDITMHIWYRERRRGPLLRMPTTFVI